MPALLDAWAEDDAAGRHASFRKAWRTAALDRFLHGAAAPSGRRRARGQLALAVVPFVDQDAFDRRLWACDLNFVRGEDSFVRALWAARPLVWHIYPQADDAHRAKLEAFARPVTSAAPDAVTGSAWRAFRHACNAGDGPARSPTAWRAVAARAARTRHARARVGPARSPG